MSLWTETWWGALICGGGIGIGVYLLRWAIYQTVREAVRRELRDAEKRQPKEPQ